MLRKGRPNPTLGKQLVAWIAVTVTCAQVRPSHSNLGAHKQSNKYQQLQVVPALDSPLAASPLYTRIQHLEDERYLLPIVQHGPNNQYAAFINSVFLAKRLNRTLILPHFSNHYRAGHVDRRWNFTFDEVFDRRKLEEHIPTATVAELVEAGWDAVFDAVVFAHGAEEHYERFQERSQGVELASAPHIEMPYKTYNCSASMLRVLSEGAEGKRFVAVHEQGAITKHIYSLVNLEGVEDPNECRVGYLEAAKYVHKSPAVRAHAQDFIRRMFSSPCHKAAMLCGFFKSGKKCGYKYSAEEQQFPPRYIAFHVRPFDMNDRCMQEWERAADNKLVFNESNLDTCKPRDLHKNLAETLRKAMDEHKLCHAFLVSAAGIRSTILMLLKEQAGIHTVRWLDPHDFRFNWGRDEPSDEPAPGSLYLDALVEQEIALHSTVFIASPPSSFTYAILRERMAMYPGSINLLYPGSVMGEDN